MKNFLFLLSIIFWVSCQSLQKEEVKSIESKEEAQVSSVKFSEVGFASWYGIQFQGRPTTSGESFDKDKLTASHRNIPLGSLVQIQNLENQKSAEVRINDRGVLKDGTIIEVSEKTALELNFKEEGFAKVGIQLIEPAREEILLAKDDSFGVDDDDDDDDDDDVDDETSPPIAKPDPKKKSPVIANPPVKTAPVAPPVKTVVPTKQSPVIQLPAEVPTTTITSGSQPKGHTVQIGVFKEERRAESFRDTIKKDFTEKVFLFSRAGTFVVQIGDFTKRDDAVNLREKLKANKVPNCFIPPKF